MPTQQIVRSILRRHLLLEEAACVQACHVMLLQLPRMLAGWALLLRRGAVHVRRGRTGAGQRQGRHGRGVGDDGGRRVGGGRNHVRIGPIVQLRPPC